ncbi:MAG TPA: dihydroneopterin aldolase [Candidatus Paceibacterota bacterium]|nr:dihydroneopterin aldolase [Verrucomicrobiota bacterium]HRY51602.1 dihydroneopterin aldolase [Candidatus Paceibacterota bacterium]
MDNDIILIHDLEVRFSVGVSEQERAQPQRLLISVEMETDFSQAARHDSLAMTIDYQAVCQWILKLSEGRSWKLLETLASEIADHVLTEFKPSLVCVEIKKFIIPEARFVSVRMRRQHRPVR